MGTTIPITVTFSEAVTVTGTPQLTLNDGAVVNYASGSGTTTLTFSYAVAAGQNTADLDYASTTALALNGGTILDAAGNAAVLTLPATGTDGLATQNIIIDTTPRAVTGVSTTQATGAYGLGTTIPITVTFSEAVTVTGTPQLTLNDGATANYASGSGTATLTFSYVVAAGQDTADLDYASTAALTLNGGSILDAAGNAALLTLPPTGSDGLATKNIAIETTAPTVTVVSSTQAAGAYTTGTTIPITVTFSHAVVVTGTPQLALNDGVSVNYASGSGTATLSFSYVVATGQNTADLDYASTAALALNGGTIQDAVGNAAVLTLPATGTDGLATRNIVIDTTPPAVTAVSSAQAAGVYGAGTTIPITITFSETVNVTGTPQLTLNNGATANYASGSGTATLSFSYVVVAGQDTADLDYASTTALALNGGTIQDAATNAAVLTLPATGTDGLATQKIVIDTTPRQVTGVSTTQATGAYTVGTTIPITVTFGEAVTVTGTPQLTLNDGAVANYASGSGTRHAHFQLPGGGRAEHDEPGLFLDHRAHAQWRQHPGCGGQPGPADPAGHGHGRPGNAENRHRHDATGGDRGRLDESGRGLRGGDDDPDHGHLQRSGHGDGHAATGARRRGSGELHQRQRHGDAQLQLPGRCGAEHDRSGLYLDHRAGAQRRQHQGCGG